MNREEFQITNAQLRDARLQLIDCDEQIRLKEKEHEAISAEMMSQICSTIDETTGKPLYSNAEKRDAELAIRQTNSKDWTSTDEQLAAFQKTSAMMRVQASFLDNDIKWGINHAADEVNAQLASIETRVEEATNHAAYTALRQLFAQITIGEPFDH